VIVLLFVVAGTVALNAAFVSWRGAPLSRLGQAPFQPRAGAPLNADVLLTPAAAEGPSSDVFPSIFSETYRAIAADARTELVRGMTPGTPNINRGTSPFEAVKVSMPSAPPAVAHVPTTINREGNKNIVGLRVLGKRGRKCVVYGMGIADDSSFEQLMAQEGCETHAFDCTIRPDSKAVRDKKFIFHNWCIGPSGGKFNSGNAYMQGGALHFKSLTETMEHLGHTMVDLLKFDIEGFEWNLFDTMILPARFLPVQLSFELHTEGANSNAVPPHLVQGKRFTAVNSLFLKLHDLGYRVVAKEINPGDAKCAEFILVKVDKV